MANPTVGECICSSTLQSWFSCLGMFILAGLSLQSFIVAVNVIDWLKGRSMTATDQIITSIGITRIIYLFSCPLHFLSYYCTAGLGTKMLLLYVFTGIAAGFSSTWLSALVATFFCIKTFTLSEDRHISENNFSYIYFCAVGIWNIFSVLIFFVSSVLPVISLGFHIRKMKKYRNVPSSTDTNHKIEKKKKKLR
ncbi:LOW QUALITY PROTEIN: taste receptor type 2 member 3-like [Aquarana catesbeiana]|uniref:LOW QUALITY PROTEIN: taste receptor type 2 member 3-like n=1 Tax=Aquarana catesbeiana TaxID=8400 RepID=UPI003CC9F4A4